MVVERIGRAAEVFQRDAVALRRGVGLHERVGGFGRDAQLDAFALQDNGGLAEIVGEHEAVVQLGLGDGRAVGKGVAVDGFACGQHALVEGELLSAADAKPPVCHVAIHGEVGMPAVGDGDGAVA